MYSSPGLATCFRNDTPGLVAVMTNRADLERACTEHWYRIPVRTAPGGLLSSRWVAFYLTAAFGPERWSVRYWAAVEQITEVQRDQLLPGEPDHPRAGDRYHRLALGPMHERVDPIFSRRRRRISFIPTVWHKFVKALEINDLHHGSPLEDRLWAAFQQEGVDAERQWFEGTRKMRYCLDFALFCPERNIDVECDGDTWHCNPEQAQRDNARNNFLEQRGWHVLRFNSAQLNQELPGCVAAVKTTVQRCGGLCLPDNTVRQVSPTNTGSSAPLTIPLPSSGATEPEPPGSAAAPFQPADLGQSLELRPLLALAHQDRRRSILMNLTGKYGVDQLARALAGACEALTQRVREHAVWCLGELGGNPTVITTLVACLARETNRKVRRLVYLACAKLGDYQLEEAILLKLEEEDDRVLQSALNALAKCGSLRAVEPIRRVLARQQPDSVTRAGQQAIRNCTRWW